MKIKIRHCGEKRHGVSFFAVFCVRKIGKRTKKKYAALFGNIGCNTGQAWNENMPGRKHAMILKERILYSNRRTRRYHRRETAADKKKNMHRFLAALWGMLSAGILLFGYVAGARSRQITMNGPVHILLEEEEGQVADIEVKPGEKIEKSAWITVEKSEANVQVRVKVLTSGLMAPQQRDLLENIQVDENWFYCGKDGYFYCAEKLYEGEKVQFQAEITVPPKWKEWTEDLQFRLELAANGV